MCLRWNCIEFRSASIRKIKRFAQDSIYCNKRLQKSKNWNFLIFNLFGDKLIKSEVLLKFFLQKFENRCARPRPGAYRDICRTVTSIRAKEKTESGRKRTVRGLCVLMRRRPLLCTDETVDLGQRWGPSTLPISRGCTSHNRRLRGFASPLGKLDIARRKMARVISNMTDRG